MDIETRNFAAPEIRADDNQKNAAGIAAPFEAYSHDFGDWREKIAKGAFKRSLEEAAAGDVNLFCLWAHDMSQPLGSTRGGKLTLEEREDGLYFDADISRMTPIMRGALEDNDLGVSIGFRVRKDTWETIEEGDLTRYERTLEDIELLEVSLLVNPAYPQTSAAMRSLESFKEEFRKTDNVDTSEQLKRVLFLQHRLRTR